MAVRRPLYNNSGNIQEMTDAMIDDIKTFCIFKYQTSGAVNLTVDSSNSGNLSSITDSRLQAGAASTSASAFPNEATTAEPSVVNVTWNRITQQVSSVHNTLTADDGKRYPVYFDTQNNIQAMNAQDMKDTFIHPAFDIIFSTDTTTNQAGTYYISTSTTLGTGSNRSVLVSSNPVYTDTRADTSAYTAGGIGETLDQPTNVTNYYLHKNDFASNPVPSMTLPLYIRGDNDLQVYPTTGFPTFDQLIENFMGHTATSSTDGYTLRYDIGTSSANYSKGTGIADTRLNGSGNYQTRFVNADDYRAQEFPDGSPTTINTYYLRLIKA
tara:strand:+ start:229 stop:1203 length:975 start_codon:yes stop_codon:yes gene_type:complete